MSFFGITKYHKTIFFYKILSQHLYIKIINLSLSNLILNVKWSIEINRIFKFDIEAVVK